MIKADNSKLCSNILAVSLTATAAHITHVEGAMNLHRLNVSPFLHNTCLTCSAGCVTVSIFPQHLQLSLSMLKLLS